MTAQTKTIIKSYFNTGDRPTEANFGDLVDSYQDVNSNLTTLASAALGSVGLQVLATTTTAAAQAALGGGTVGRQIFQAITTAAAQSIISSGDMTKAVYDPANISQQLVGTTAVQTLTNKTLTTPTINQGNLVGTTTNDNAVAGSVGEYQEASLAAGSATSLTTGTAKTVISLSLTAGDWDVWGNVYFTTGGTTSTTAISAATSIVNNTFPSDPDPSVYQYNGATVTNHFFRIPAGAKRYSFASTTTVYLVTISNFTVSTTTAYGIICARRVR